MNCTIVNFTNSSTSQPSSLACSCNAGYVWNATSFRCQLNCSSLNNTLPMNPSPNSCACVAPYEWNPTLFGCVINCAHILYASSQVDLYNCSCISPLFFNTTSKQCQVNCSGTPNTTNTTYYYGVNNTCQCVSPLVWSNVNWTCGNYTCPNGFNATSIGCVLDCSSVQNSNGTWLNLTTCGCNSGYYWVAPFCYRDCTLMDPLANNTLNGSCICSEPMYWDAGSSLCIVDCDMVQYANGTINRTTCLCIDRYSWNMALMKCVINCTNCTVNCLALNNTNGTVDNFTCKCQVPFRWDPYGLFCRIDCSMILNADLNVCYLNSNYTCLC